MKYFIGKKKPQHYKGLLIKADLGLHDQISKKLASLLKPGATILDLGAGEGALSQRLTDLGFSVIAADKDGASFRCDQAEFVCLNFDSPSEIEAFVNSRKGFFDAVLGVEVIEHVQDQWRYTRQLLEMVKPGGIVLVTTPNITSWLSRLKFLFSGKFHQFDDEDLEYGHINPMTPWELDLVLRSHGVQDITIEPAGTLPMIYIDGSPKIFALNLLAFLLRPFSSGYLDGWCIMAMGFKQK